MLFRSGMVWNKAVRPGKRDHWMTYPHERQALFEFIGKRKISGVVLVGGDVHRTRVLRHSTQASAGYRIPELITSPIHSGVIALANAPHRDLIHDSGEPNAFLLLTVDDSRKPAELAAALQGVAAVVDRLTHNIDNADEKARSSVEGLHIRAGNPRKGDRKSTRLNSSHSQQSRMPSSA